MRALKTEVKYREFHRSNCPFLLDSSDISIIIHVKSCCEVTKNILIIQEKLKLIIIIKKKKMKIQKVTYQK